MAVNLANLTKAKSETVTTIKIDLKRTSAGNNNSCDDDRVNVGLSNQRVASRKTVVMVTNKSSVTVPNTLTSKLSEAKTKPSVERVVTTKRSSRRSHSRRVVAPTIATKTSRMIKRTPRLLKINLTAKWSHTGLRLVTRT